MHCFSKMKPTLLRVGFILFFHLHLYNHFADITLADTGSMAIFGEIDGELSRIDLGVGCRTVDIESDVFLLVIRS